jgi:hypothetical protein
MELEVFWRAQPDKDGRRYDASGEKVKSLTGVHPVIRYAP